MQRRATFASILVAILAALGVTLAAGTSTATTGPATPPSTTVPPTTAPPVSTPPTTAPPTTTPPTTAPTSDVRALQDRLVELGYWLGTPDGDYGFRTEQAVLAFQKAEGLPRDGVAGLATRKALATATRPNARTTSGDTIEIDLDRQLLLIVRDSSVRWAFNTSTGRGGGWTTPRGHFEIEREIDGVRSAALGDLYRPKYFNEGIAVHGSPKIPAHPASHGCARVSNPAMDFLWSSGLAEIGTPVWVY